MRKIRHEICQAANWKVFEKYTPAAYGMVHNVTKGEGYIYDILDMLYSAIEGA